MKEKTVKKLEKVVDHYDKIVDLLDKIYEEAYASERNTWKAFLSQHLPANG